MAWLVFGGLKVLEDTELAMESVKFALLAGILGLLFLSPHFRWGNLTGFSFENVLLPYGVLLFAMLGTPVIPEAHAMMQKCRKWTKRAIIIGTMIPAVVYALFTIGIVGISGEKTTEVATVGAAEMVNGGSIVFHLFAVLAMASSFVALAFALKDTFRLDLKRTNVEAWMLTLSVPLVLLWLGVSSFTATLELAGAFAGGIAGICIVLMHRRARGKSERKPEYRILPGWFGYAAIILLLAVGMAYQLSFVL